MRARGVFLASIVSAALLVGCANDEVETTGTNGTISATGGAQPAAAPAVVSVKTLEYRFEAPTQFAGGLMTMELDNSGGKEAHEVGLVRLEQGKSLADFAQAMRQGSGPPPPWAVNAGGPGPVQPGGKAIYTANLQPGTYAFVCLVHSPDGQSHAAKGMLGGATVVAGQPGVLPRADATIVAKDYEFSGFEGLRSGDQVVHVENEGQLEHNWGVFSLRPGQTAQDLATFLASDGPPSGPPPFTGSPGLIGALPRGGEATRTLELRPGTYALVCFVRDPDGRAHYEKGMVKEFTIG
jgi:uncharacterized cupredoxin-like copper-binding protein